MNDVAWWIPRVPTDESWIIADLNDVDLETPDWIGRLLWGLDDPLLADRPPTVDEAEVDVAAAPRGGDAGGDLGRGGGADRFWIAPEDWCLAWLAEIRPMLDRPRLYIATDAPDLLARFAAYEPVSAVDRCSIDTLGSPFDRIGRRRVSRRSTPGGRRCSCREMRRGGQPQPQEHPRPAAPASVAVASSSMTSSA